MTELQLQLENKGVKYLQTGQGPAILFIHGLGIGSNIWNKVITNLSKSNTIILLDLPGYGLNKNLIIEESLDSLTQFINNFIVAKKTIKYLVGYSMGGVPVYKIAQNPPPSLKKIMCIATPFFTTKLIFILNILFRIIGFHYLITKIFIFFINKFPLKQLIFHFGRLANVKKPKAMNECMDKFGKNTNLPYFFRCASSIFSPTEFSFITIPIDFIYGQKDGFATIKMAKKVTTYCKSAKIYTIRDRYHLLQFEDSKGLADIIKKNL